MNQKVILTALILTIGVLAIAQKPKNKTQAERAVGGIEIDGKLDDADWSKTPVSENFVGHIPENGSKTRFKTEVRVLYDDNAIYFGFMCHDDHPDSISTVLDQRDGFLRTSDCLVLHISPFNDGISWSEFWITASGVQKDILISPSGGRNVNWDVAWESAVNVNEQGWVAELKIPLSSFRFPAKDLQQWGFNAFRLIRRHSEWVVWNELDPNGPQGSYFYSAQQGEITGIKNLTPPLRLSFSPYTSVYIEKRGGNKSWEPIAKAGVDLKYGINESFTLDMKMIPDFGQVQQDDQELNLSPFELQFEEKRQFFTEGKELFQKGDIFYSRRIGEISNRIEENKLLDNDEEYVSRPLRANLINATKISGRTKNGLGIGFLNSISNAANATVKDTLTNQEREVKYHPVTNYNVMVVDQYLPNKSYVSFINTNYFNQFDYSVSEDDGSTPSNIANVSATDFYLSNKKRVSALKGIAAYSFNNMQDNREGNGYKYLVDFHKIAGEFKFNLAREVFSKHYNPNFMGFNTKYNIAKNTVIFKHKQEPFKHYQNFENSLQIDYEHLHRPSSFSKLYFLAKSVLKTTSDWAFSMDFELQPLKTHDFFEPRVDGYKFIRDERFAIKPKISNSFSNNPYFSVAYKHTNEYFKGLVEHEVSGQIIAVFSDQMNVDYVMSYSKQFNDIGFKEKTNDDIIFGERGVNTWNNVISLSYLFSNTSGINLRTRHYWSQVDYSRSFLLLADGNLQDQGELTETRNYNALTTDLKYTWNFAPASELSVVWQYALYSDKKELYNNYFSNFSGLSAPPDMSFSVKLIYFLDYNEVRNKIRNK